jgi:hypothetical protein
MELHEFAADGGLTMSAFEYAYRRPELATAMGIEFDENGFVKPGDRSAKDIGAALPEAQRRATEYVVAGFAAGRFNTRSPEFKENSEALRRLVDSLRDLVPASPPGSSADAAAAAAAAAEDNDASGVPDAPSGAATGSEDVSVANDAAADAGHEEATASSDAQADTSDRDEPSGESATTSAGSSADAPGAGSRRPNHPDTRSTLDLSAVDFEALPINLKARFYELDRIKYRDLPIATSVLLRSLLELSIKHHFSVRGNPVSGTLKPVFQAVIAEYAKESALKNILNKINGGQEADPGSIRWFNAVGHDAGFSVRHEDVAAAWKQVQALVAWLVQPPVASGQ